ncbi:MAG: polysaccharide deacetylase family protein [Candidatus Woesearchaeota archaeon]
MVVKIKKFICLTFDIEEFDLVNNKNDQFNLSYIGTLNILRLLNKNNIRSTFFITSTFAEKYPSLIKEISKKHEIANHGYSHEHNYKKMDSQQALDFIKKSKFIIEKIIGKKIYGFRAPGLFAPKYKVIKESGHEYDSSLHPTFGFFHYNNFFKKRKIYVEEGIKIIPVSVTPLIRAPLFWFAFKNFGLTYIKTCTKFCFIDQNYVNMYFHSWEFSDLKKQKINYFYKRNSGLILEKKLNKYITWCLSNNYEFITIKNYINKIK